MSSRRSKFQRTSVRCRLGHSSRTIWGPILFRLRSSWHSIRSRKNCPVTPVILQPKAKASFRRSSESGNGRSSSTRTRRKWGYLRQGTLLCIVTLPTSWQGSSSQESTATQQKRTRCASTTSPSRPKSRASRCITRKLGTLAMPRHLLSQRLTIRASHISQRKTSKAKAARTKTTGRTTRVRSSRAKREGARKGGRGVGRRARRRPRLRTKTRKYSLLQLI